MLYKDMYYSIDYVSFYVFTYQYGSKWTLPASTIFAHSVKTQTWWVQSTLYRQKQTFMDTGFSSLQHVSWVSHDCPATSWGKMWTRWWSNLSFEMFISKLQNLPKAGLNIKRCICMSCTFHVYIFTYSFEYLYLYTYAIHIWYVWYLLKTQPPNATIPMNTSASFSRWGNSPDPTPGNSHKMCRLVLAGIACSMVVGKVFPKPTEELLDRDRYESHWILVVLILVGGFNPFAKY